jgi:hypothetical protein
MKALLRLPLLIVLMCLFYSPTAYADTPQNAALYSGAVVTWTGTAANPNKLFIHNGNSLIDGTFVQINGTGNIVTKTEGGINKSINFAFATDVGAGQAINTAYYVYYAIYFNPTLQGNVVISTCNPNPEGDPSCNIAYTAVGGTVVAANEDAVFLGSYITDGSGDIIPFNRVGDDVILTPLLDVSTPTTVFESATIYFQPTDTYPEVKSASIAGLVPIPKTATAMIVDVYPTATSATDVNSTYILNPVANTIDGTGGACKLHEQAQLVAIGFNVVYRQMRVQIASGSSKVWIGACVAGTGNRTYQTTVSLIGYVETVHHLTW